MLRLKNITKSYKVAGQNVPALKGIDLSFRKNEFVSILGPSGCGKTTTLNIIGGLDHYTDGDLFIGGVSTKLFKSSDWDTYRNHRIGFIFQSYNLIPHQTILGNVELALTIAGINKEDRIKRAKMAIDRVGLKGQYYKKPNQLSGGQCQRVAIARALVNEPDILLADEPTGALDTQTSVQIMELIKDISKDKLVIMVTHNPELAEEYSTRIIRLLDGKVQSDSNPFSEEDEIKEVTELNKNEKNEVLSKTKMSMATSFKLSFKNLLSKKKRTILTCIAGSIGIVGVASVLSVSRGVKDYIASMQDDMLSGNPITVSQSGIDYSALMNAMSFTQKAEIIKETGMVNVDSLVEYLSAHQDVLMSILYNNKIDKNYVDYVKSMPSDYYSAISLEYGIDVTRSIYTDFNYSYQENTLNTRYSGTYSVDAITNIYKGIISQLDDYKNYADIIVNLVESFRQGIANNSYIETQYEILDGNLPQNSNDVLIVLGDNEELTDLLLAQLGYYSQEEFINIVNKGLNNGKYDPSMDKRHFTYEELRAKTFTWYPNDTIFKATSDSKIPFIYNYKQNDTFKDGISLNICGIVKPKDGISYGALKSGFLYTEDFSRYVISQNKDSEIVQYSNNRRGKITSTISQNLDGTIDYSGIFYLLDFYFDNYDNNDDNNHLKTPVIVGDSSNLLSSLMTGSVPSTDGFEISADITTRTLGGDDLPSVISVYPTDFEQKDNVTSYLDKWNGTDNISFNEYDYNYENILSTKTLSKEARGADIKYADPVGLMIEMINVMINIITIALVCFSSLSLVVSAVMIGIITYVSVLERTKEIGVIRSLGGRKKDVSNLFNAETILIGLTSGIFGIIVTAILCLILNTITKNLSEVGSVGHLTLPIVFSMILVSSLLTVISGFFPAWSAAKRDPVEALRME